MLMSIEILKLAAPRASLCGALVCRGLGTTVLHIDLAEKKLVLCCTRLRLMKVMKNSFAFVVIFFKFHFFVTFAFFLMKKQPGMIRKAPQERSPAHFQQFFQPEKE